MADYTPKPEDQFTFGLWTVGNIGRDPFGVPVPQRRFPRSRSFTCWRKCGAYGVNYHDNDLIPIDATPAEADQHPASEFKQALADTGTESADGDDQPVHRPGVQGRRVHVQRPESARLRHARR